MNIIISLKRAALTAAALGTLGATAAFAQTAPTPAATDTTPTTSTGTGTYGGGWKHHRHHMGAGVLSQTERTELKKDREAAFAANPALKTQEESLHQQFKTLKSANPPATQAQWQSLKTQHEALKTQLRTAIESQDSGAAALFQKIDAAKGQHHHGQQ
ncbi:MAG TPA: hypothetical protein VHY09_01805 [Candidatus Methylacidiphilales bacterium]|nr:hypothetical protein [Candidatus Methylacidiphilales bacterium]